MGFPSINEFKGEGGALAIENLEEDWIHAEDVSSDDTSGVSESVPVETEEERKEKQLRWAYQVMDWVVEAFSKGRHELIEERTDDVIVAFIILVEPKHRDKVFETLRKIASYRKPMESAKA